MPANASARALCVVNAQSNPIIVAEIELGEVALQISSAD